MKFPVKPPEPGLGQQYTQGKAQHKELREMMTEQQAQPFAGSVTGQQGKPDPEAFDDFCSIGLGRVHNGAAVIMG